MGKHIDKLDADATKHIHTLPVFLGERLARYTTVSLIIVQYILHEKQGTSLPCSLFAILWC